ncbi:MAG: ABC transporter ATP-binding protein [Deltaproteobacteria bacterium]|nr:ABC transporter ATP-binding protein [Deltaproteobacteria bacterium]NND26982.1 ABC transporter ATP-binding protein [Myxococcales bacterium]MBT8464525.1 ABC transporter ATP-binding protein [Deltaproteobacteria bacterium]MBT8483081.1 ABC transporter ATP-binding protein [Deltaproteobacteria bacterium]NNK05858.1 ABC transporter ATP-binding protein [Myxococcales bacterium]
MSDDLVLEVIDLHKTFHIGFFRKRVEAVRGTSFSVKRGEIFGLLGPNGAGKTTTIKSILRLIFPTKGEIRIFGRPSGDREAAMRVGYMPENPYVYQYLKPIEFLDLCGRLVGLDKRMRRTRSEEMIDKVGLRHAADRPIGKFSKGMMQRIGLAQALLHDPELLVLDEPMSGLDPIGRKEVRDLLVEQRERGKTLLFTSHILSDVELLCDRVVIMNRGEITSEGQVHDLLESAGRRVEIRLSSASQKLRESLASRGTIVESGASHLTLQVDGQQAVDEVLRISSAAGARLDAMVPERESLENLFVKGARS